MHLMALSSFWGVFQSTKDIDLIIPEEREYVYLVKKLEDLGYENTTATGWTKNKGFIFDLITVQIR